MHRTRPDGLGWSMLVLGGWVLACGGLDFSAPALEDVTRETTRLRDKQHANANTIQDHELRIWKLENYNEQSKPNSASK